MRSTLFKAPTVAALPLQISGRRFAKVGFFCSHGGIGGKNYLWSEGTGNGETFDVAYSHLLPVVAPISRTVFLAKRRPSKVGQKRLLICINLTDGTVDNIDSDTIMT